MTRAPSSVESGAPGTAGALEEIRIFISYRRDDVGGPCARALWSDLGRRFGEENVFRDVTALEQFAGRSYEQVIDEALDLSDVELVLIGEKWATDENLRRLENEEDLHRREIEGALSRGIEVIPVLVEGAQMPSSASLPPTLAQMQKLEARRLDDDSWGHDIGVLTDAIEARVAERRDAAERERREREAAERETRDRVFMSEAEELAHGGNFEAARKAADLVQDRGRCVEALVAVARAQNEAGASDAAGATLDAARDLAPQIEDGRTRAQALALVEVEREERVRELVRRAREHVQAGTLEDARAALDSARVAADELEAAPARQEALAEVGRVAGEIAEHTDTEREEHLQELVHGARSQVEAGAIEEARVALDSARAAAEAIESAEGRERALSEMAKAEAEIVARKGAEREERVRELVAHARELPSAGAVGQVQAVLDSARAAAEEIEDADGRGAALALVAEVEEELLARRGCFDTATPISGASGTVFGDNTAAGKEEGEPEHAGNAGGRSVWYRWTAPEDGAVTIDTVGSDFDTLLAVYRGSSLSELQLVAQNDDADGRQSRVCFPAGEGDEYRIAVDGYAGASGTIVLNWEVRKGMAALVQATGLHFQEAGDGAVVVPFAGEHADHIAVTAKELADGVAFFCVDLPALTGFGTKLFLKELLALSYGADYVKAIPLPGDRFALVAEVPATGLTPEVCEGLVRGLVALGDVTSQTDLLGGWQKRLDRCREVQERHISIDPQSAGEQTHAMLAAAGLASGPPGSYELNLGLETHSLAVLVNRRVISLVVTLQGVKPGGDRQKLRALLELNRAADVAKIGLDAHGNVTLLYEVPGLVPGLMERVRTQFASLHARVTEVM